MNFEIVSFLTRSLLQLPQRQRTMHETVIHFHSRSSVVVLIDAAYVTSYQHSIVT